MGSYINSLLLNDGLLVESRDVFDIREFNYYFSSVSTPWGVHTGFSIIVFLDVSKYLGIIMNCIDIIIGFVILFIRIIFKTENSNVIKCFF